MLTASFQKKDTMDANLSKSKNTLNASLRRGAGGDSGGKQEIIYVKELPDVMYSQPQMLYYVIPESKLYGTSENHSRWVPIDIQPDGFSITAANGLLEIGQVQMAKIPGLGEKLEDITPKTFTNSELDELLK